jgi:uncharacterized protein YndB with AHSA1/START domain
MARTSDVAAGEKPKSLTISRTFAAPRHLVFKAWSTAEHLRRWFSPADCTVPEAEVDFRPGGAFVICMRSSEGTDYWSRGTWIEISPLERLVFVSAVAIADEKKFTAHTTVTFQDDGAGTRMTVRQEYDIHDPAFASAVEGSAEGWRTTLDKLEQEVARMQVPQGRSVVHASFSLERVYDASPGEVFHALTDRAAKARWFEGGGNYTTLEREMDVRPGGRERVKGRWASGMVTTFDAVYFDVVPNARLVYTYEMHLDEKKISVSLATMELRPEGAGTRLVVTEQGAFLDGYDDAGSRANGTGSLLDRLGASLRG